MKATRVQESIAAESPETNPTVASGAVPARRHRRFRRFTVVVAAAMAACTFVLGMEASPAAAYQNQWVYYDLVTTDRDYEMAVHFDGYGRATQVYADVNNNGTWDAWTQLVNGQARAWLFNTVSEFDGRWDAMINSNGQTFSNLVGCASAASGGLVGGGYYSTGHTSSWIDPVYGLTWCSASSRLTGVITAPNLTGNYLITLTRLVGVAPALHCYTYPNSAPCVYRVR